MDMNNCHLSFVAKPSKGSIHETNLRVVHVISHLAELGLKTTSIYL